MATAVLEPTPAPASAAVDEEVDIEVVDTFTISNKPTGLHTRYQVTFKDGGEPIIVGVHDMIWHVMYSRVLNVAAITTAGVTLLVDVNDISGPREDPVVGREWEVVVAGTNRMMEYLAYPTQTAADGSVVADWLGEMVEHNVFLVDAFAHPAVES